MSDTSESLLVFDFGVTTQKVVILEPKSPHNPLSYQIIYYPLEDKKEDFPHFIKSLLRSYAEYMIRGYLITISSDSAFSSTKEAVEYIGSTMLEYVNESMLYFYTFNNDFVSFNEALKDPVNVVSTGWWALGNGIASMLQSDALIVDFSTRCTELIPIKDGAIAVPPMTDHERIEKDFLLFNGMLETNVAFIRPKLEINGKTYNLPYHYHANMADIFLITNDITPPTYIIDSPDKGPKTVEGALNRLRKTLCIPHEIDKDFLTSVAEKIKNYALNDILSVVKSKISEFGLKEIVVAGIGEDILYEFLLDNVDAEIFRASNIAKITETNSAYFVGWLYIKK